MLDKCSLTEVNVGAKAGGRTGKNEGENVSDLRLRGKSASPEPGRGSQLPCLTRNCRFLREGRIHEFDVFLLLHYGCHFLSSRLGECNRDMDSEHILLSALFLASSRAEPV